MKSRAPTDRHEPPSRSRAALEAADWLIRLTDTDFDAEEPYPQPLDRQRAFFDWLAGSTDNVRVFYEILEVERRVGHLDPQESIKIEELLAEIPRSVISLGGRREFDRLSSAAPNFRAREQPPQHASPPKVRAWWFATAAAAVVVAVFAIGWAYVSRPITSSTTYYSTSDGERGSFTLQDGSVVTLNAASQVAVTYDRHTREVRLIKGEAFFDVHHEALRPFRVAADDVFVEDLGTQFDIDRRDKTTRVTVSQGSVQLVCGCVTRDSPLLDSPNRPFAAPAHPSAALTLSAGDQVSITYENRLIRRSKLSSAQLALVTGWRDGVLSLNGETLSSAVEKLNAYSTKRIVIVDPAIADTPLHGICKTSQAEACAKMMGGYAGVIALPPDVGDSNTIRLARNPRLALDRTESDDSNTPHRNGSNRLLRSGAP